MKPPYLLAIASTLAAGVLLAGCSSVTPTAASPSEVAEMLQTEIPRQNLGSTFTGVTCVERGRGEFRCSGTFKASLASVRKEMANTNTAGWTDADWDALIAGRSGTTAFDVTVDAETGNVVWVPA